MSGKVGGMIKVLVVEDHRMVAQAMVEWLGRDPEITITGVTDTGGEGIKVARREKPDVVLMDFDLPDMEGTEATRTILRTSPQTKVVMVTGWMDESTLANAMEAGCIGYITKERDLSELSTAVRAAARGEALVSMDLLPRILRRFQRPPRPARSNLTNRETEVLKLLTRGLSNEQIASRLGLSQQTVRTHVQRIIGKLGCHSKLEAVTTAVRRGIVNME